MTGSTSSTSACRRDCTRARSSTRSRPGGTSSARSRWSRPSPRSTRSRLAARASGRSRHAGVPVPLRRRARRAVPARRRGTRRRASRRDARDALEPSGRLLRRRLARPVGDRARRRDRRSRDPRARPARARARAGGERAGTARHARQPDRGRGLRGDPVHDGERRAGDLVGHARQRGRALAAALLLRGPLRRERARPLRPGRGSVAVHGAGAGRVARRTAGGDRRRRRCVPGARRRLRAPVRAVRRRARRRRPVAGHARRRPRLARAGDGDLRGRPRRVHRALAARHGCGGVTADWSAGRRGEIRST